MGVHSYERRLTRVVNVGGVKIGGENPIVVQSMITEKTREIPAAAYQAAKLHDAGAQIVRITTQTIQDAKALGEIRQKLKVYPDIPYIPIVADVHHQGSAIAIKAAEHADKIRINPGLFVFNKPKKDYTQNDIDAELAIIERTLVPVIKACQERGRAMRIGVNHGSLSPRLTHMFGDTSEGMAQSALEYIRICEAYGFGDLVISMKASNVQNMIYANRLMAQRMDELGMDYPMHLGVTEAGKAEDGRAKSHIGIGALLVDGIGDTIRASLTEDPINEPDVCDKILHSARLRLNRADIISCPGCGRTEYDLPNVTDAIKAEFGHLKLRLGVMGCIVNGPGEMADAQYGYVGKGGKIALYRGREELKIVPQEEAFSAMKELLKQDGQWEEPPVVSNTGQLRVLNPRLTF